MWCVGISMAFFLPNKRTQIFYFIQHNQIFHKVVIILKAMAAFNLSTKNSNHGREVYLAMIRNRSVNNFLFSVTYETDSKSNMIKYYSFLSFPDKKASADFSSVSCRPNLLSSVEIGDMTDIFF